MAYPVEQTEKMYQGRAFTVRRDRVRLPDGGAAQLDIVEHVGAVTIVPVDADGQVWFVRQYRHATGQELLELPAGTLEPGEAPEVCAAREIREEIGMRAGTLRKLGEFYLAPGYSTEYMHVFLATSLTPDPLPGDQDEFLSIVPLPLTELDRRVASGEIQDGKSLAGIYLMRLSGALVTS
ncbi:MAG: NUDIX hydrolase [Anaerolineales bacterium]|jgi:ADP-ribose pyrophosphatase|nr:NUDIX hydrolase [Anaerolineales bacterium]